MASAYTVGYYTTNPLTVYNLNGSSFNTLANSGLEDSYIIKYASSGAPQWTTRIGGTATDLTFNSVIDLSNNLCVTGTYDSNPVTFYNADTSVFTTRITSGINDGFVCKYDPTGNCLWAARMSGIASEEGIGIVADNSNNVFVAGAFNSIPVTFYNSDDTPFANTLTPVGAFDGFLVKYNESGFVQWVLRIGGIGTDVIKNIITDTGGNVYLIGQSDSTIITFFNSDYSSFLNLGRVGLNSVFVAKYDINGFGVWASVFGGTGSDYATDIGVDSVGNIYATGYYSSNPFEVYDSTGTLFGTTLANVGSNDIFLVKFNNSGITQWVTRIAGTDDDKSTDIVIDSNDNILVAGNYNSSSLAIYDAPGTSSTISLGKSGTTNRFAAKYNPTGVAQWSIFVDGNGVNTGSGLALDSADNIYFGGNFTSNPLYIFNSNNSLFGTTLPQTFGVTNGFIIKYSAAGFAQWANYIGDTASVTNTAVAVSFAEPEPEPEPEPICIPFCPNFGKPSSLNNSGVIRQFSTNQRNAMRLRTGLKLR